MLTPEDYFDFDDGSEDNFERIKKLPVKRVKPRGNKTAKKTEIKGLRRKATSPSRKLLNRLVDLSFENDLLPKRNRVHPGRLGASVLSTARAKSIFDLYSNPAVPWSAEDFNKILDQYGRVVSRERPTLDIQFGGLITINNETPFGSRHYVGLEIIGQAAEVLKGENEGVQKSLDSHASRIVRRFEYSPHMTLLFPTSSAEAELYVERLDVGLDRLSQDQELKVVLGQARPD